jgi:septal ring factor EnvC (AmiA/AmiB activator)
MAKKVLLQGYLYAVLDCDLAEAMKMVGTMVTVETEGYGKDLKAIEAEDRDIDFKLIDDRQFIRAANEKESIEFLRRKREAAEASLNNSQSEKWKLEDELKKLKAEIATLKEVCPHKDEDLL